jgi:VCBS repeat-containing protein
VLYGTQNDDRYTLAYGGESIAAGNGQDRITYDASAYVKGKPITQTLEGGQGTDTLTIKLTKAQFDAMKAELYNYAASLPKELNFYDQNIKKTAENPLQIKPDMMQALINGTLTTGQNNQSGFFEFQSIGVKVKQFEALRFEIVSAAPVVTSDTYTGKEDQPVFIKLSDLLGNDVSDGGALKVIGVSAGVNGTAEITGRDGVQYVKFDPARDFNGRAEFTYTVQDASGKTGSGKAFIDFAPVNDAAGGTVTIKGTATEGQVLTALGALWDKEGLGTFQYQWQAKTGDTWTNITGATAQTYTLTSQEAGAAVRAVISFVDGGGTLEQRESAATTPVVGLNKAPVAVADSFIGAEDHPTLIKVSDLLANDTDANGDSLTVTSVAAKGVGAAELVTISGEQFVRFTAPDNFNGNAALDYTITDGKGGTSTAQAAITVTATNDAPTGSVQISGEAKEGQTLSATNTLADADGLGPVSHQWEAFQNNEWRTVGTGETHLVTKEEAGAILRVVASYTDQGGTHEVVASASTNPVVALNKAPVAVADSYTTDEDTPLTVSAAKGLLANDTDADGNALRAEATSNPAHGTLIQYNDGSFVYKPDANWHGTDSFTYRVSDGALFSDPVKVDLTVNPVNDAPVLSGTTLVSSLNENTAAGVKIASLTGTDADGDTLSVYMKDAQGNRVTDDGNFKIDTWSGAITTSRSFDYETDGSKLGYTVFVDDGHGGVSTFKGDLGINNVTEKLGTISATTQGTVVDRGFNGVGDTLIQSGGTNNIMTGAIFGPGTQWGTSPDYVNAEHRGIAEFNLSSAPDHVASATLTLPVWTFGGATAGAYTQTVEIRAFAGNGTIDTLDFGKGVAVASYNFNLGERVHSVQLNADIINTITDDADWLAFAVVKTDLDAKVPDNYELFAYGHNSGAAQLDLWV